MCNCLKCPECGTHLIDNNKKLGYETTAPYWCKVCEAFYENGVTKLEEN